MKLIFNPFYDAKVFVKNSGCTMDEKVVGPKGLLDELELRAGLTGRYLDDFQRSILYARALKKALNGNPALFFAPSFDKDKLGTAATLLRWRDTLVKNGWDTTMKGSQRLDDLAVVESFFEEKGEADRWRDLLKHSKTTPLLEKEDTIEVTCKKELLEPLYRQLLDNISSQVEYKPLEFKEGVFSKTRALIFKNDLEMSEWLAQQPLGDNDLIVCDDASILNIELALNGKPQVGAESDAIGAIMQIFTLGIGLFNRPINVNTLLAYLQVPSTPLNAICVKRQTKEGKDYYMSLRRALIEQLLDDNGISEKFGNIIDEAIYNHDGNDISKEKSRKNTLLFIKQWERVTKLGDQYIVAKDDVVNYLKALKKWARTYLYDESKALQFNAVVDNCDSMLMILEDEPNDIKTHDLMLWATQINRPVKLDTLSAQAGSCNITRSVTDIHTVPDTLYWVCTTPAYNFQFELGFLSPEEIGILKNNNLEFFDRESMLKAKREMMLDVLANVKGEIQLLECEVIGGVVPVEDPVATEIRHKWEVACAPTDPDRKNMVKFSVKADSTKQGEYSVESSIFKGLDTPVKEGGLKRESESYSSLDELIQRPFDYVMNYILHLKEYGKAAMDDINTVKGTVAHNYVEKLTEMGNKDVTQMRNFHATQFDTLIVELVESNGALLLLEENDLEFKRYKNLLKKSIDVLLDIIENNHLTIVGAEQYYEAEIDVIGNMNARIDYVLTDSNGDYVIIDFKWNEGKTYVKKLKEDDALQLAVYRAVLEQYLKDQKDTHKVSFTGYYVLPRHTLYTVDSALHYNNIEVVIADTSRDLMKLAANSYTYRMKQLKSGLIEEGEKLELANLQYHNDTLSRQLYPLRPDYNDKTIKGTSYGNKNIVLKGGLE